VLLTLLSAGQRAIVLQLSGHDTRRIQDWFGRRAIQTLSLGGLRMRSTSSATAYTAASIISWYSPGSS
jgi:hypothetical protein